MTSAFQGNRLFRRNFIRLLEEHISRGFCIRGTCGAFTGPSGSWQGTAVVCGLRAIDIIKGVSPRTWCSDPDLLASALDLPKELVRLFDWVFENIPDNEAAYAWPFRFFDEIGVGANLTDAWPRVAELLPRTVPEGLAHLLQRQAAAERICDDDWDIYRSPNGLGIPAAAAVGEAILYVLKMLQEPVATLQDATGPSAYDAPVQALLRSICGG